MAELVFLKSEQEKRRIDVGYSNSLNLKNKRWKYFCVHLVKRSRFFKEDYGFCLGPVFETTKKKNIKEKLCTEKENRILDGHLGTLLNI